MNLPLEEKTMKALLFVASVFDENRIPYKIGGGLAARVYGAARPVNDIDISVSGKHFPVIVPKVSAYITAGLKHYLNEKWDCDTLSINYGGQDIDMTDVDTLKMSNLEQTRWMEVKKMRLYDGIRTDINGVIVSIMDPRDLIAYKRELGGEHQLADVAAIQKFLDAGFPLARE